MNWFGQMLNRLSGNEQPSTSRIIHTGRTAAGVYVDADTALRDDVVWACVRYLSNTVAQLPFRVQRDLPGGGSEIVASNPADYLLHKRPNPEMGSFTFRQTLMGWALTRGNGYAEIEWDNRGSPYALWPIHPDRVVPRRDVNGALYYEVGSRSGVVEIAAEDMFHIRGFGDGPVGFNVIEYAAQTIGWAQATKIFGATFFGEGMNPSGLVETAKALTVPAMEQLRGELDRVYKGPKGKRTAILDAGMKFTKLATNPDDAQFIESMQHQVNVICRWFGVPPHKVQHLLQATFSNIEQQSIEVVVDAVMPWVKTWEDEADYKLFGSSRQPICTKMNLKGLLRGDQASRATFYTSMFQLGMTINQILAAEDMNGIGPDGDKVFVSNNVQTLERAIAGAPLGLAAPKSEPEADPTVDPPPASDGAGRRLPN